MGIISVEQTDRLYWLGRYTERVYSTMRLFFDAYDSMIDQVAKRHREFCAELDIPDIYTSPEDFCRRYPFDETDENSLISNLKRAYDNAIVLREEIGSEALSYIQLAIYDIHKAAVSKAPLMELQHVIDNLMAFWGICDDQISSQDVRSILKIGKRIERIDLYGRLHRKREDLAREVYRLEGRMKKSNLKYREDILEHLVGLVEQEQIDYPQIVREIEQMFV